MALGGKANPPKSLIPWVAGMGIDKQYLDSHVFTVYGIAKGSPAVPDVASLLERHRKRIHAFGGLGTTEQLFQISPHRDSKTKPS